jgi:hypothetical protein
MVRSFTWSSSARAAGNALQYACPASCRRINLQVELNLPLDTAPSPAGIADRQREEGVRLKPWVVYVSFQRPMPCALSPRKCSAKISAATKEPRLKSLFCVVSAAKQRSSKSCEPGFTAATNVRPEGLMASFESISSIDRITEGRVTAGPVNTGPFR